MYKSNRRSGQLIFVSCVLGFVLFAGSARAEGVHFDRLRPFRTGFMFDLGYGTVDKQQAAAQRIGDSGFSFALSLNSDFFQLVTLAAHFGTIFVGDKAGFEQGVVDNLGNKSTAQSTLNLYNLGLSAGLRTPSLVLADPDKSGNYPATWLFVRYGKSWQSASRSINMCGDCNSEHIELGDGSFIDAGALIGIFYGAMPLGLVVGCNYKHYLGDSAFNYALSGSLGFTVF